FATHYTEGWATCPVTENGAIRVLSQSAYPSGKRSAADVIEILRDMKTVRPETHHFFTDHISLTDRALLDPIYLIRSGQVTDVYLLALAQSRNAVLVSFDRNLPWQAIRGASAKLVKNPA